jgi:chromosome segregation ATPase
MYLYHVNTLQYLKLKKDEYLLGRTSGDFIFESDNVMSGKHCLITIERQANVVKVYVEDLVSKNRTVIDRAQIPPKTRVRLFEDGLLEVGEQMFILTSRNNLKLDEINSNLEPKLEKQIIALETFNLVQKMRDGLVKDLEALQAKEAHAKQKLTDNKELIKQVEAEIEGVDRKRKILLAELESEANALKLKIHNYNVEMSEADQTLQDVAPDIEELKVKIGRLKSLPQE